MSLFACKSQTYIKILLCDTKTEATPEKQKALHNPGQDTFKYPNQSLQLVPVLLLLFLPDLIAAV